MPRHTCIIYHTSLACPEKTVYLKYCQCMVCEEDKHRANLIGELVQVSDGQLHLPMSQCEVCALIEYVCIM